MNVMWQFAVNTPWWVYVLLIYLINIGVKASKTRVVKLRVIFIVPLIFVGISLHTLLTSVSIDGMALLTWSCAIFFGLMLGWGQIYHYVLRVDKKYHLIKIPGSWSTLVIVIAMFMAKYYFSYELVTNTLFVRSPIFESSALAIFGASAGFFIGKLLCYLYRFKTLKHSNLVNEKVNC